MDGQRYYMARVSHQLLSLGSWKVGKHWRGREGREVDADWPSRG